MKVVMIGADRSVKGGVSAMVNHLYEAGLDQEVDLTYIGTMVDGKKWKKVIKAFTALVHFICAMPGTNLVHVNMAADASCMRKMIFMQVAHIFRKKVLIHEHGGDFQGFYYERCSQKRKERVKKVLNQADLFIVLSDQWKDFFSDIVEPSKIRVLENGVPVPEKEKKDYASHKAVFLGRLCKEKGIGELLEAIPVIRQQIPDFSLVLGGVWETGNEELKVQAERLSDAVNCPGWVTAGEREQLFDDCSIFVLPTWFEGQPVSLLEAMAAGMCAAATEVGGIPQIMLEEYEKNEKHSGICTNGCLLKAKDTADLADSMIMLLKDDKLRERMGRNARTRIINAYSIEKMKKKLLACYREALQ